MPGSVLSVLRVLTQCFYKVGIVIMPILQMRELRDREVK